MARRAAQGRRQAGEGPESLAARAYERIESLITTLRLRPGAPVFEAELSARLGIGRTPVREALQRLARERMVEVVPRRGYRVAPLNLDDQMELLELRRTLEPLIVRAAACRASPEQRQRFAGIARDMRRALEEADSAGFARQDALFNQLCLESCGNAMAAAMMRQLQPQARRFWFVHHGAGLSPEGTRAHIEIAEAIAAGDPEGAAAGVARLCAYIEERIRRSLPGLAGTGGGGPAAARSSAPAQSSVPAQSSAAASRRGATSR